MADMELHQLALGYVGLCFIVGTAFAIYTSIELMKARAYRADAQLALDSALVHLNAAEEHLARIKAETLGTDPDGDPHEHRIQ